MSVEEYIDIKKIKDLIKKYRSLSDDQKSEFSERDVCTKFIIPLIDALNWDVSSINEVKEEKSSGSGFVDVSLSIYGKPKILVENKKFGSLDGRTQRKGRNITFEEQVFDYAYHLNADWCVLTNFEELRLIFAKSRTPRDGKIVDLKLKDFFSHDGLRILKYLSKLSVMKGEINSLERKRKRLPINVKFSNDLLTINKNIITDYNKKYPDISLDKLQEISQRLLGRLLMIRSAEDWNFLPVDTLQKEINHWEETTIDPIVQPFRARLDSIFNGFSTKYNTKIFEKHEIDDLIISDNILITSIRTLYNYNFDKIGVDVLGSVYEEYLGHILKEKQGRIVIDRNYITRQKKGIYYTPPAVVKYIISKTVDFDLESENKLKQIKIADISCGSGSFLVEAFNLLENHYKKFHPDIKQTLDIYLGKTPYWKDILKNLYGVDIDSTAAELASVNLSLRAMTKDTKLPSILGENILVKNSLKLDSIPSDKFDYVIGNPPYIQGDDLDREEHENLRIAFPDIYYSEADYCFYFIKKGIDVLKKGGKLGFIVAKYFLKSHYGDKIRNYILSNCKILEIVDLGNIDVFEGIGSRCCIIIIEKNNKIKKNHKIKVMRIKARKLKIPKERIFEQIFLVDRILENEEYVKLNVIEGFYKKQTDLDNAPWILIPNQFNDIYTKCVTMYDSFGNNDVQIGRGGITGLTEIFSLESDIVEKNNFEKEIWKDNIKNSDIDRYLIQPLKSKV
ncbi:MAG: N-6 DNA methylase, partial [Candidatus Lokiarchaeota archaeon]|nr:N-6 DNA methylase [Candidatus Lokiarchaeota archaeon]